jgi:hypothetical protein
MSHDPIAYTAKGAAYCPPCAVARFGRCQRAPDGSEIIEPAPDARRCGMIACPDGYPKGADVPGAVFSWDSESWADGGLSCDDCGAVIIADAYCRECDSPLADHAQYTGPDGKPYGELYCAGAYLEARVRVIVAARWPRIIGWGVSTGWDTVPFAKPDGDPFAPTMTGAAPVEEALDTILAAYAGKVATFELLGIVP